ncbi:hypothetical protein DXX93_05725 [Thalassotalea euphylliae]|uniref:Polysaccharide biosynthesis protein n=2 Tax=Thalassotalea euphylliae TaxID=1655234 RepID=A0A3E0TQ91_9GAMM|nr:hypothetical protein DXX93_05725 [Thalassotalea euphylliae]
MFTDMLAKGIPFLLLPVYTIYLKPEQFGNIAIFNVIVEIAIIFVVFGANSFYRVEYFKPERASNLLASLFKNLIITFPAALLLTGIFIAIDINPGSQSDHWLFSAVLIALMQSIVLLVIAEYQCQGKALWVGALNLTSATVTAIVTVLLLNLDFAEESRYWGFFIGAISTALLSLLLIRYQHSSLNVLQSHFSKPALSFGLGILPHALSWWARTGMDRFLIAKFVSVYQVGLYSVAAQISLIIIVFANAANQAFTPKLMQMLAVKHYKESFALCIKIIAIYLLISIAVVVAGNFIFDWFINEKYRQAADLLPYMCLIALCQATVTLLSNFLYFFKHVKALSMITSLTSLLHVGLAYFLVQTYSVKGVIVSSIVTYLISAVIIFCFAWRLLKKELENS